MIKSKFWLRAIPLAIAMQGAMATTNLITDGGFELGIAGWTSTSAVLSTDARAAYSGSAGLRMQGVPANASCVGGATYTLNTAQLNSGTMYEIGVRTRLEVDMNTPAGTSTRLSMALIKNNNTATPIYLDGYANTAYAYTDRWSRLFGAYKADFLPTDTIQLCISSGGKTVYVDDVFVRPLTRAEVGYTAPATMDYTKLINAYGNKLLIGTTGTPILLKGTNVHGYNYGCPYFCTALENYSWKNYDETSFQEIAGLGFNTVRFLMSSIFFEDDAAPGIYKEEGWAWLDRAILMAKKYNLRLILDMHEPPGGSQLPNMLDISTRPDLQARLENLWAEIATRYRTEPTIVAYDLVNEPYMKNWFGYVPTLINKIRAIDPDHLILVEQSYNPNDLGKPAYFYPLPYTNIIYDEHYYDTYSDTPDTTAYTGSAAAFQQSLPSDFINFYNAAADTFIAPLNIGEYGVVHQKYQSEQNLGAEQWLKDLTAAMDKYGIHRQMFSYHEERFGLHRGWNTYPGESTITNTSLQTLIPTLNASQLPPSTVDMGVTLGSSLASTVTGKVVSYQITIANKGNTAADATVQLSIPAAGTVTSVPTGCTLSTNVVTCQQTTVFGAATPSWLIGVSYAQAGTWSASATVTAGGNIADNNTSNNSATKSVVIAAPSVGNADVALTTFSASGTPTAGKALGLNIVLINNGITTADNVTFTLPLPAGVTMSTGSATECSAPITTQIVCSFGSLTKGTSRTRILYIKPSVKGALSLTGTVSSNNPDTTPANNAKTLAVTVN